MRVSATKGQQPDAAAAKPLVLAAAAAAAAAVALIAATTVVAAPAALAAADIPNYGPWTLINMTPFNMELAVQFERRPTCTQPSQNWGTDDGCASGTYPSPRGRCNVANVHATAVVPPGKPGDPPRVVAEADWAPTDPDSQRFSTWVVLQYADKAPPEAPTNVIRVVQVVD
jgi:hypothetical protein